MASGRGHPGSPGTRRAAARSGAALPAGLRRVGDVQRRHMGTLFGSSPQPKTVDDTPIEGAVSSRPTSRRVNRVCTSPVATRWHERALTGYCHQCVRAERRRPRSARATRPHSALRLRAAAFSGIEPRESEAKLGADVETRGRTRRAVSLPAARRHGLWPARRRLLRLRPLASRCGVHTVSITHTVRLQPSGRPGQRSGTAKATAGEARSASP
jgi:hypothetical protein